MLHVVGASSLFKAVKTLAHNVMQVNPIKSNCNTLSESEFFIEEFS